MKKYVQWRRKLTAKHWEPGKPRGKYGEYWKCKKCEQQVSPGNWWYMGEPLGIVNHIKYCYA